MNIDQLLRDAADDTDRPLGHGVEYVVRRGRRRARARRAGVVATSGLAVAAVVTSVSLWPGHQAAPPSPAQQATASPPPMSDAEVHRRCVGQLLANGVWPKYRNMTWHVPLTDAPDRRSVAVILIGLMKRFPEQYATVWTYCRIDRTTGRVMPKGITVDSSGQMFWDADGLWGRLPRNAVRLTFQTPDGQVRPARAGKGFFSWLHYGALDRGPIVATWYDAAGKRLGRMKINPGGTLPPCDTGGPKQSFWPKPCRRLS